MEWYIEKRKLSELKLLDNNPRTISKTDLDKLKKRIADRGFHDIIKINQDNEVLSGNQRVKVMREMGIEEVDVKVPAEKLTKKQQREVIIESNTNDGEWDIDKLIEEFEDEIEEMGLDGLFVAEDGFNEEFEIPGGERDSLLQITYKFDKAQHDYMKENFKNGNELYNFIITHEQS